MLQVSEDKVTLLVSLVPDWSALPALPTGPSYREAVSLAVWASGPPEPTSPTSLARPRAAGVLLALLQQCPLHGPQTQTGHVTSQLVELLSEAVGCHAYLARLGEEALPGLAGLADLLACLTEDAVQGVVRLVRGRSLAVGGVWAAGLTWLLASLPARPSLESLLPRPDCWTDGELATAGALLGAGAGPGPLAAVEAGRLAARGGLAGPGAPARLWLISRCLSLGEEEAEGALSGGQLESLLAGLLAYRAEYEDQLLYCTDLAGAEWEQAGRVAALADCLAVVVWRLPAQLSPELWDLACCSLVSWTASLADTGLETISASQPAALLAGAVCRLAARLGAALGPVGSHPALSPPPPPGPPPPLPDKLREEWSEFFCEGVQHALVPLFLAVAADQSGRAGWLVEPLAAAVLHCPSHLLATAPVPALHLARDLDTPAPLPPALTALHNHIGPLLLSTAPAAQLTAAHLLASLAPATAAAQEKAAEGEEQQLPARLVDTITQSQAVLDSLLGEFPVGELAGEIPAGCPGHTAVLGFLLAWRLVLKLVGEAGPELRPRYTEWLRGAELVPGLLQHLFRLLPANVAVSSSPGLLPGQAGVDLTQLAASCWLQSCRHLPAITRAWWRDLDRPACAAVERLTSRTVTPLLWAEESRTISSAGPDQDSSLAVRVRDSVREVVATYTIDEGSMELVVSLPANHPLGELTVESGKRVGVETTQWRRWMLQLTTFLTHQNGTILDGLNLWKKNVDKRFEGVEVRLARLRSVFTMYFQECYICFYILHGSNHQLPKLACRTCKKKFHSACLYKWFSTSNNSSCPLCRNLF